MRTTTWQRAGLTTSTVGLGCWQLGSDWAELAEGDALAVLGAAVESGVTLFDTADVYGDGRSERLIGRFLADHPDAGVTVITKAGRRANPHVAAAYTPEALRGWVDRSRANLGTERLELVQLHCPPPEVFTSSAVFDVLDGLVEAGAIARYGVSVETCEQALAAIARPHVASVQIILNIFRRKPLEQVLPAAQAAGVAVIARVPLASGLLSGRYDASTTFGPGDHRTYNREGKAFDIGETFSGVPYLVGVQAAARVAALAPAGVSTAAFALRWILDQPGVSVVIPGASSPAQARANAEAGDLPALDPATLSALAAVYDEEIREHVHERW